MKESTPTVAVVGGGLSGLAAAAAALERGFRVELFEKGPSLGGRASSFLDSTSGQTIDHCQHAAMGCCTEFLEFCRRTGIDDCFERSASLHFIAPDGRQCDFKPSRWLPAPLHLLPGLMAMKFLSLGERWSVAKTLRKLAHMQDADEQPIGQWLRACGQSERAVERFWSVVLVSALGETVDHASLRAAQKVFCDGFMCSRGASDLILPRAPLGDIFHNRLNEWLTRRGAVIHTARPVQWIEIERDGPASIILADGTVQTCDAVVVAVAWRNVRALLAEDVLAELPGLDRVDEIRSGAITAVHLWFDRPLTPLRHAVLIGRLGQWIFSDPKPADGSFHCQVVISAAHRMAERSHDELLSEVRRELESLWPSVRFLRGRVVAQPAAVFSMAPDIERLRPPQQTPIENLALAGDWTATGWPATMEGALRSGRLAVEALCRSEALGPANKHDEEPTVDSLYSIGYNE